MDTLPLKLKLFNNGKLLTLGQCVYSLFQSSPAKKAIAAAKPSVWLAYDKKDGKIHIENEEDCLKLTKAADSRYTVYNNLIFDHAMLCPCAAMQQNSQIYSFKNTEKPISFAAVTLVLDSQKNILLTRRSKTLNSFPRAWVNAGGRIDYGETFEACAKRELAEETGIFCTEEDDLVTKTIKHYCLQKEMQFYPFLLYESVFPTHLDLGLPQFQTLALFFAVELTVKHTELDIKLQESECDAHLWLPFTDLVNHLDEEEDLTTEIECTKTDGTKIKIPLGSLQGVYPNKIQEGLGLGHVLAIKHYYESYFMKDLKKNIENPKI
jgi:8-oxo-dGTP pyrophosphatase MutT (NUDIX family)